MYPTNTTTYKIADTSAYYLHQGGCDNQHLPFGLFDYLWTKLLYNETLMNGFKQKFLQILMGQWEDNWILVMLRIL